MYTLNNESSPRSARLSREFTFAEDRGGPFDNMALDYEPASADRAMPRYVEKTPRTSRLRSSIFGVTKSRRKSVELKPEDQYTENMPAPAPRGSFGSSASAESKEKEKERTPSFAARRRMRKSPSKSSISSIFLSETAHEEQEKLQVRPPISEPFDFTHLAHTNPKDFGKIKTANPQEIIRTWNNSLRELHETRSIRYGRSRPGTAVEPANIYRRDSASSSRSSFRTRPNSNTSSLYSNDGELEIPVNEMMAFSRPVPSLQPPARHCTRISEVPMAEEAEIMDALPDGGICHAITTVGHVRVESQSSFRRPDDEECRPCTPPLQAPQLTETFASPEQPTVMRPALPRLTTQSLLTVRTRPLSQISGVFDRMPLTPGPETPSVTSPQTPIPLARNGSMVARRMSRIRHSPGHRRSRGDFTSDPAGLDSWADDIDWCYEHNAEANCDFNWDGTSVYSASVYDDDAPSRVPTPMPFLDISAMSAERGADGTDADDLVVVEKRITAFTFEDRLLLPPSPGRAPSPTGSHSSRSSHGRAKVDSGLGVAGFEIHEQEDQSVILRAASTALRHRSLSNPPSLPELIPARSHREELVRVARQLEDHIETLNKDGCHARSPSRNAGSSKRTGSSQQLEVRRGRSRADSDATCLTVYSDADAVTPTDTNEIVTPASSAHNSINFSRKRSMVNILGDIDEDRADKVLSYPAAIIPGVVEIPPNELPDGILINDQEVMHLI